MSWIDRLRFWIIRKRLSRRYGIPFKGPNDPTSRMIDAFIRSQRPKSVKPLDLFAYRDALTGIPRPTEQQISAYAEYVSGAHSWYKHLPLTPPGEPFVFYIDPHAGMDLIVLEDGEVVLKERSERDKHIHYNWRTTAFHHENFGHLAYASGRGTSILTSVAAMRSDGSARGGMLGEKSLHPVIYLPGHGHCAVPEEVPEAGQVELTGVIHSSSLGAHYWKLDLERRPDMSRRYWPEESGGEGVLKRILWLCEDGRWEDQSYPVPKAAIEEVQAEEERYRSLLGESYRRSFDAEIWARMQEIDKELTRLIEPERRRLFNVMESAMRRVCDLVF